MTMLTGTAVSILDSVTGVFTAIGEWIVSAVTALEPMFYSSTTGLTFLGTLGVCGLGIGVTFLVVGVIQNFLHFRG